VRSLRLEAEGAVFHIVARLGKEEMGSIVYRCISLPKYMNTRSTPPGPCRERFGLRVLVFCLMDLLALAG
jgi:hypothetical protein